MICSQCKQEFNDYELKPCENCDYSQPEDLFCYNCLITHHKIQIGYGQEVCQPQD